MEQAKDRIELIKAALGSLEPTVLSVEDQSARHAGHAGAQSGGGHFALTIVSDAFEGKTAVRRHQMIYEALGELMKQDIHAISINAKTPNE
ncbi:MAG TPA: BolA family protein [Gammaproteobacteria bacterium]|nr:BolA family protein [Gammaproteobacteria bacterium]